LYTHFQGSDHHVTDIKFFGAVSRLLDRLPLTSAIVIPHRIIIVLKTGEEFTTLEEWLFPFEEPTGTVVYQLKLVAKNSIIETQQHYSFGSAAEELRTLLKDDIQIKVCYFCKYLVEYNDFGGTDYRHDQLYCFRDSPETLDPLMHAYPRLRNHEDLLAHGTPDMDALHSCAAFTYRATLRP
jgi:hypothetical protein